MIIFLLCASAFSDILILNSGDTVNCDQYRELYMFEKRIFLCNGDTIHPNQIYSKTNENGTFRNIDATYLKKMITGRVSFYTGIKEEIIFKNFSEGFDAPSDYHYKQEKTPVMYYTFDDIVFTKYNSMGRNSLLVKNFKENKMAYRYYRRSRATLILSSFSAIGFLVPFTIGLVKYDRNTNVLPFIYTSAAFTTISTGIALVLPTRLFKKAISCYNSN